METNFGTSTPYSVGIEERVQLVDSATRELVSAIEPVLEAVAGDLASHVKPGLLQAAAELSTRINVNVPEAVGELTELRSRLSRVALENGAAVAAAGTHPFSRSCGQRVTDCPRSASLAKSLGWSASRQPTFGLHVHVGIGSAAKAVACADGVRNHLPELLALSANSPFWEGLPTGLASTRVLVLDDLPRTGIPPDLGSFDEFERLVQQAVGAGCFPDYTHIWWDVRPHPRFGTVEVRICDAQTRVSSVAAIAGLVQSLAATIGSAFECGETEPAVPDLVLEENRRRAMRDGLDARLIDLSDGEQPATEVIRALVERCEPAADALGCTEELGLVESILVRGNGAEEQRRVYEETRDPRAVAGWLVAHTAYPKQPTPAAS